MASQTTTILLLLIITTIGLFAVTTTARPCKTIFFITSSTSTTTFFPNTRSPNSHRLTFFITEIHQIHRPSNDDVSSKSYFPTSSSSDDNEHDDDSSIDVYGTVGSLLFGVGCGAVTAAVLYLIWSLCSDDDKNDDFDIHDDVEGDVSRNVYVANGGKEVPPTADEVEAMK